MEAMEASYEKHKANRIPSQIKLQEEKFLAYLNVAEEFIKLLKEENGELRRQNNQYKRLCVCSSSWNEQFRDAPVVADILTQPSTDQVRESVLDARVDEVGETSHLDDSPFLSQTQMYSSGVAEDDSPLLSQTQMYSNGVAEDDSPFLSQTQMYSSGVAYDTETEIVGGTKRKAAGDAQYNNNKKSKRAAAAMLTPSKEGASPEDVFVNVEERAEQEQGELVPLLTGAKLKSYQMIGLKWLISLYQNKKNGILADEMGLGKTIQTIGFLAHLIGKGEAGPYLIIAPLSTLSNWLDEIKRFTLSLKAIIYHGTKLEREDLRTKHMPREVSPEFPIVITSYEVTMKDAKKYLRRYKWKYLVVDEAHRLKNSECKLMKALEFLTVEKKLLLTGTPLQNNLSELWSLLNFILPPSVKQEYDSWFDSLGTGTCNSEATEEEAEKKRWAQVVPKLRTILRPILFRRMKIDVEPNLPPKKEMIIYADMTEKQKRFRDHLLKNTLEAYLLESLSFDETEEEREEGLQTHGIPTKRKARKRKIRTKKAGRRFKGKLKNMCVQLRKNCYHPDLLEAHYRFSSRYPEQEEMLKHCGKFRLFDRLMERLIAGGHKVLVFSQWTKVLDIMVYYFLEKKMEKKIEVCRIDGKVELDERSRQIKEFNDVNSDCRVFLLSTRAGGLGINLTAADTCIIYDSDWNPQMDIQAMDRCHRIGQPKPVHIYRLATAQSIEGRILKRAFSKLKLEDALLGERQFEPDSMSEEDLLALLRDGYNAEDKEIQTEISDEDLERLLDRSDMEDENPNASVEVVVPLEGPGWEVVIPSATGGMLSLLSNLY